MELEPKNGKDRITRSDLRRVLAVNAATKPTTIAIPTAVIIAGIVFGLSTLMVPLALVIFAGLFATTFFDADEAEKVGKATYAEVEAGRSKAAIEARAGESYAPEIASALAAAREQERCIKEAVAAADMPFTEVSTEVDSLMREMERIAKKAQLVYAYLDAQDPEATRRRARQLRDGDGRGQAAAAGKRAADALEAQLHVQAALSEQLERFLAEMEHLTASLGVVHGQMVRMSVAEESLMQDELASQVRELRDRVGAVAEGLNEAFSQAA